MKGDMKTQAVRHRWRDYCTATGGRPVKDFMDRLLKDMSDGKNEDYTAVTAAMMDVARHGMDMARHMRGDIYEARASGKDVIYRVLFAQEGKKGRILLSVEIFEKKTEQTDERKIRNALRRLADWRARGAAEQKARERDPARRPANTD